MVNDTPVVDEEVGEAPSDRNEPERYRIERRLGKGGMGEVMAVLDEDIGRAVALKRIRKAHPSPAAIARFLREAHVQARLEHPAIVPVYDIGRDRTGLPYFVMRRLSGTTLRSLLEGAARPSPSRLLRTFVEVCLAIEFAHQRGVVHRDLKPENIMLGDYGEVYVLDWGLAKVGGELAEGSSDATDDRADDDGVKTTPGLPLGTEGYMAPEQAEAPSSVDNRADIYSLGCILFEILGGTPKSKAGDARPSSFADVPPELDEVCTAATEPVPSERIATARELGDRVQRYLDGDRDLALRRELAAAHFATAREAAARDDDDGRRVAMREAGRALALDPEHAQSADLLARLMVEPPKIFPREVAEAVEREDRRVAEAHLRFGARANLAFLAFCPLLWWIAPASSPYPIAIAVAAACNAALCWWSSRALAWAPLAALGNAAMLVLVARGYSPFLVAPALAVLSAMVIVLTPTRSRLTQARGATILIAAAVLAPWILERLDAVPVTTTVAGDTVVMRAAVSGETRSLAVAAGYVVTLIIASALLAHRMRARERAARRDLQLQAWHLRQLAPH